MPWANICEARLDTHVPWQKHLEWLQNLCRLAGVSGIITGRGLRAGGATDYFSVGATAAWVRRRGGWLSDAYLRYDRPTPRQRVFLADRYSQSLKSLL